MEDVPDHAAHVVRVLLDYEAEEFIGYVLDLCLEQEAALDPEAWAAGSVSSDGQTFSGVEASASGAELHSGRLFLLASRDAPHATRYVSVELFDSRDGSGNPPYPRGSI